MLTKNSLENYLATDKLSARDKLLLCLAVDSDTEKAVKEIRELAVAAGMRAAKNYNISAALGRSKGVVIRTNRGWKLTNNGKKHVQKIIGTAHNPIKTHVVESLRDHLAKISDDTIRAFVNEAVECFEYGLFRAAVVLSWVGAVSVLYKEVIDYHLAGFNAEALRRNPKWKSATSIDDLAVGVKEKDFLDILQAISVIGKNTKQELVNCLERRNSCGHPNSYKIGENVVTAHIETLILNVFSQFSS